jgi:NTP pyrophosphatase (non-canonical NTP hydrolase)
LLRSLTISLSDMLNQLAQEIHENAKSKGFYDETQSKNVPEKLMLIVSEVSEGLEAHRKGKRCNPKDAGAVLTGHDDWVFKQAFESVVKDKFEDEIADAIIRLLDLSAWQGMDIQSHVLAKMRYNSMRERMHGKLY